MLNRFARLFRKSNGETAGARGHRAGYVAAALAIGLLLAFTAVAQACPLCAEALESQADSGGGGVVKGFFWSILLMVSMPFLLFGGFTALVVRAYRKAEADHQPSERPNIH
jgi:hypothetical protein